MKSLWLMAVVLLVSVLPVQADTQTLNIEAAPEQGAIYPLALDAATGSNDGAAFLSLGADILQSVVDSANALKTSLDSTWFQWSYNRGIGTIPNTCASGYDAVLGLCAQQCPQGYSAALGACWQNCPAGYTDMGGFCTNWKNFKSVGKQTFSQHITAMSCPSGKVNEAGLCYDPCADSFNGVGPLCIGRFDGSNGQTLLQQQLAQQHDAAQAQQNTGGIHLTGDAAPQLRTSVIFTPIMCSLDAIDGAFGILPDPASIGALAVDAIGDAVIGEISSAVPVGGASFIPSVADTVLFDFSADARCADDGVLATASLMMKPSVTVKVSTSLFDPALHNLAGVDLGIMKVSVYELIPFRIYGTVGTTLSAETELSSVIDRSLPPLLVDGVQHSTSTALSVTPEMDLWLSSQAYIRITSLFSFIPDLLQLGAEFKLHVLDVKMPYEITEGVRVSDTHSGYELFRAEQLNSELSSGHGYVDTFLRVFGIETNAFGDEADIHWTGHQQSDELMNRASATPLAI